MSLSLKPTLAALGLLLAAACSPGGGKVAAPEPVKAIDLSQFYTGRWYEIGRTPMKLTDGCVAGTTDYYRRPDGQLIDRDACRDGTPAGKEKVYDGPVTILDPGKNTKITVRYTVWGFFPVSRTYWMIDRDDGYRWFIVSDPAFENVSIFTRAPRPTPAEVEALKARVRQFGYDPARLDVLKGEPAIGQAQTTEKELRPAPDGQIERAVLAFFWSVDEAIVARDRCAPSGEVFALQHTVSKGDLVAAA